MSEKAILKRLSQTEQLRELSIVLMKAKKVQDEKLKTHELDAGISNITKSSK